MKIGKTDIIIEHTNGMFTICPEGIIYGDYAKDLLLKDIIGLTQVELEVFRKLEKNEFKQLLKVLKIKVLKNKIKELEDNI